MRIGDLGIAKPTTDTVLRTAIGTHGYMAPELSGFTGGNVAFGKEVDIYAFGIVLWELFSANTVQDFQMIQQQQQKGTAINRIAALRGNSKSKIGNIPSWLNKLIEKCCSASPSKRPTANDILNLLTSTKLEKAPALKLVNFESPTTYNWSFFTLPDGFSVKLNADECEYMESKYQSFLSRSLTPVFLRVSNPPFQNLSLFLIDFNHFTATTLEEDQKEVKQQGKQKAKKKERSNMVEAEAEETEDKREWLVRRARVATDSDSTKKIKIGKIKNNKNEDILEIRGFPLSDCSDIVKKITISYNTHSGSTVHSDALYLFPFQFNISNLSPPPFATSSSSPSGSSFSPSYLCITLFYNQTHSLRTQLITFNLSSEPNVFLTHDIEYSTRFVPNPAPPFSQLVFSPSLSQQVTLLCQSNLQRITSLLSSSLQPHSLSMPRSDGKITQNGAIYDGMGGVAYFYWKLSRSEEAAEKRLEYLKIAEEKIQTSMKDQSLLLSESFFCGMSGVRSLASVIYCDLDDFNTSNEHLEWIVARCESELEVESKDVLAGNAGLLSSLLFLLTHLSPKFPYRFPNILENLIKYAKAIFSGQEIIYHYTEDYYLGAAHGLSGILHVLMHISEITADSNYSNIIKKYLDKLISQHTDGIFPSKETATPVTCPKTLKEERVFWCHGSAGILFCLVKAYQVFDDKKYLKIAKQAAEKVWERGIVLKGLNLCHGVCGNSYALLELYKCTKNEKYLYYAYQFCVLSADLEIKSKFAAFPDPYRAEIGRPDNPFSLMEGISGEGCFYLDLLNPLTSQFPGFAWNNSPSSMPSTPSPLLPTSLE